MGGAVVYLDQSQFLQAMHYAACISIARRCTREGSSIHRSVHPYVGARRHLGDQKVSGKSGYGVTKGLLPLAVPIVRPLPVCSSRAVMRALNSSTSAHAACVTARPRKVAYEASRSSAPMLPLLLTASLAARTRAAPKLLHALALRAQPATCGCGTSRRTTSSIATRHVVAQRSAANSSASPWALMSSPIVIKPQARRVRSCSLCMPQAIPQSRTTSRPAYTRPHATLSAL